MLSFQDLNFDYEPYPIGVVAPVLAAESYRALVDAFPPLGLFGAKEDLGLSRLRPRESALAGLLPVCEEPRLHPPDDGVAGVERGGPRVG